MIRLNFWGAARTTTGSMHIVEANGSKIALDCGLFQGRRAEFYERNRDFPLPPGQIDSLVLSHAHIDHCGNIPNVVKQGFEGSIYCTHATQDLGRALLLDSGYIQEKDAQFVSKRRVRRGEEPVEPLYTVEDAQACFPQFVGIGYYRWCSFVPGMTGRFLEAGHILGSAISEIDIDQGNGKVHRLVFSGDIGRRDKAILRDPEIPGDADTLILECTYGNRTNPPPADLREELRVIVQRVAERSGKLIIPAFSVGRTQEIVYQLNHLFNEKELPRIPIFVDSPLSANVTEIFRNHPECFNRQTRDLLLKDEDVFGFHTLTYIRDVEDSKALNDFHDPCVIISASGMCEAGRILHHLRNSVEDPKNMVLIVGYQAEHTLGRRIAEKHPEIKIFGEKHKLRAEVETLHGFSAHADAEELRDFAFRVKERSGGLLKRVFLVHGEIEGAEALKQYLTDHLKLEVYIPKRGETVNL